MVLRLKKKKGITVQVDYIVSVLEIKPWPPSIPLCSVQTVLIQWENGDHNSGFLPPGVPSLNGFDGGKIDFNEFFKLPVTLCTSKNKPSGADTFQKNYLEFHLYEPRKDKAVKGQLLGTATINLAEYGIIKEGETVTAAINMKKMTKGMTPTFLSVKIQPFDNEGIESVLKLMSEHCEDESELISDDDIDEGTSNSFRTPSVSDASKNSQFQIDEVLNFVAVGLNSEMSTPRSSQPNNTDGHQRKHDQAAQKDVTACNRNGPLEAQTKNDNTESGNDDRNSIVRPAAAASAVLERDTTFSKFSEMATKQKSTSRSSTFKFGRRSLDLHGLKHMKSVRVPSDTLNISAPISVNHKPLDNVSSTVVSDSPVVPDEPSQVKKEKKSGKPEKKGQLEAKVEMLEEELKESAAIEMSLYSALTEHVNSKRKVHSPARRLSRFYRHSCGSGPPEKRARAARAIVSGLVLVSKASGSDVSRLTFWLSNMIMLRAIVSQINKELPSSCEVSNEAKGKGKNKADKKSQQNNSKESQIEDEWEEPQTFILALEKLEAWTFYRMVESLWWQSFTPHMQTIPAKKKGRQAARKTRAWRFGLGDQEQGTFSIRLWKKAFQDAWERLCPLRAAGHDCGCLPMLSKSVMEQLVYRLDVAMFNAVLRDSDQEMMPTDPVSDPITDPKVLPIPCGKSSFGAGAQLKNAVGSWSSWLTDFYGDTSEDNELVDNNRKEEEGSFKGFRLLNALSDLMMLPLGMLSDDSTRKEARAFVVVCPLLGAPLIKRVLNNFIPDEFSPDPVPESLLIALESEDLIGGASKEAINNFPCKASAVYYAPVPMALLSSMIGEPNKQKGGSSILRKSYNSDDDLERMNSPLAALIKVDNNHIGSLSSDPNWLPQEKVGTNVVRYKLLQQVWKNGPQN
ncbi:hypothetical protein V2J09_006400 [Rumex salicifolius]